MTILEQIEPNVHIVDRIRNLPNPFYSKVRHTDY